MTKFFMTDGEIITDYRQAKDQKAQVKILAEQNCVSVLEMRLKLSKLGLLSNDDPNHQKRQSDKKKHKASSMEDLLLNVDRKVYGKLDEARAKELYDQGMGDQRIANALNVAKSTVASWRKRNGLPNHQQQLAEKRQAKTKTTERGTAAEEEKAMKKDNMPAGVTAPAQEEVSEVEETVAAAEEMPGSGETLTVRGLYAIAQRLLDFGLGEAHVSIAGKALEDFRRVTVQLDGDVQIDLS